MHTAVSTNRAFITLGIGNLKIVKTVGIVAKVICGLTFVADVVGLYLFIF